MILDATKRVAESSLAHRPNSAHTLSSTTDMMRIASGSKTALLRIIGIAVPGGMTHDQCANVSAVVGRPLRILLCFPQGVRRLRGLSTDDGWGDSDGAYGRRRTRYSGCP
jgi:hypothetical protein